MRSPTQRSIALLKSRGYIHSIAEHYNAYSKRRIDLFGFVDIVALNGELSDIVGVQTTTGSHLSDRIKKARSFKAFSEWLEAGGSIEFHGWRKIKAGRKAARWQPIVRRFKYSEIYS